MMPTDTPLSRDRLHMVPRDKAADAAHISLFQIQDLPPDQMVAGVAVLYTVLCTRLRLDPEALYHMGNRILRDREYEGRINNSLMSLRDFAGIHIAGEEGVSIA